MPLAMLPSEHLKGVFLTTAGVLILSPDTLLLRLIGADIWTLLFWRGLLCAIGLVGITLLLDRSDGFRRLFAIGRPELQIIAVNACMHVLFVLAILNTSVANVLVIMSISPLLGAILSRFVLGEPVARRTWNTTVAVFIGLVLIFSQSLGGGTLVGDLSAFAVAVLLACNFVLLRRYRKVSMIPAVAWSMAVTAAIDGGHSNARFQVADALNLQIPDNHFDAVHCHSFLMHVPDTMAVLAEIKPVLKEGGVLGAREPIVE